MRFTKNPEWLRQKYWDEGLTITEIAKALDMDDTTVWRWFKRLDIPRRPRGGGHYKHGEIFTRLYRTWTNMKVRCRAPMLLPTKGTGEEG